MNWPQRIVLGLGLLLAWQLFGLEVVKTFTFDQPWGSHWLALGILLSLPLWLWLLRSRRTVHLVGHARRWRRALGLPARASPPSGAPGSSSVGQRGSNLH